MIVFVGVFWMFPLGLYHGFLQLRGININTAQTPPEIIFLVGWIFYIIASGDRMGNFDSSSISQYWWVSDNDF